MKIRAGYEASVRQVRSCGVTVSLIQADVSGEEDVQRMVRRAVEELGGVDMLINDAGIQIFGDSHEIDAAQFDKVLAVNLRSVFLWAREAIRFWLEQDN